MEKIPFQLEADFEPSGDQPQAIEKLIDGLETGFAHQTLLGVTGSGKSVGYEDIRIFRTDKGGLQGIAASLHLERFDRHHRHAEQVLFSLDEEYNIVDARPIRGEGWSRSPQKNWAPFDHCEEPRFLYAIDKGTLFAARGELRVEDAVVRPSTRPRRPRAPDVSAVQRAQERAREVERDHDRERDARRGRRDTTLRDRGNLPTEGAPSYVGLRGGTQLVSVGPDAWLGIGHAMKLVDKLKYYWHVWYLVDARGRMKAASVPMKLAPNGIEFAAGMAIDGDRVVVSFGVDDMECRLGETKLSAVLEMLRPTAFTHR